MIPLFAHETRLAAFREAIVNTCYNHFSYEVTEIGGCWLCLIEGLLAQVLYHVISNSRRNGRMRRVGEKGVTYSACIPMRYNVQTRFRIKNGDKIPSQIHHTPCLLAITALETK